jgi:hypothetical protein
MIFVSLLGTAYGTAFLQRGTVCILSLSEENLTSDSTADEIQTVFNLIVNRIRARCAQLFPGLMIDQPGVDEAAAFTMHPQAAKPSDNDQQAS